MFILRFKPQAGQNGGRRGCMGQAMRGTLIHRFEGYEIGHEVSPQCENQEKYPDVKVTHGSRRTKPRFALGQQLAVPALATIFIAVYARFRWGNEVFYDLFQNAVPNSIVQIIQRQLAHSSRNAAD